MRGPSWLVSPSSCCTNTQELTVSCLFCFNSERNLQCSSAHQGRECRSAFTASSIMPHITVLMLNTGVQPGQSKARKPRFMRSMLVVAHCACCCFSPVHHVSTGSGAVRTCSFIHDFDDIIVSL